MTIVGAGPAGLIAAQVLAQAGCRVDVYERMPSPARKFLLAGRGGLNLTHSETRERFLAHYGDAASWLAPMIDAFPPARLRAFARELGEETFVGSSGRVFPKSFKASPLLRGWLIRLEQGGVRLHVRHLWRGWSGEEPTRLLFETPDGEVERAADAVILALGGASWPRLGSDGGWAGLLAARGIDIAPLRAANAGARVAWSPAFGERFAGQPLKRIALTVDGVVARGEAMIDRHGLEGGAIYALSARIRDRIDRDGAARLILDLRPDVSVEELATRLTRSRKGESMANRLRKAAGLSPAATGVLREGAGPGGLPAEAQALAALIKFAPLTTTAMAPLERAISTAGGVARSMCGDDLMLANLPGVFVAGEMLDWEAPTGGYLLQACLATGHAAAQGVLARLGLKPPAPWAGPWDGLENPSG